jgi:hypothetical protein
MAAPIRSGVSIRTGCGIPRAPLSVIPRRLRISSRAASHHCHSEPIRPSSFRVDSPIVIPGRFLFVIPSRFLFVIPSRFPLCHSEPFPPLSFRAEGEESQVHRCAEIPRPRCARARDDNGWDGARTRDDRGSRRARTRDEEWCAPRHRCYVIPSRRRGISVHRCAEIPRPRCARTRDDRGPRYARARDDRGRRSARARDDRGRAPRGLGMTSGGLRADSR